MSRNDRLTIESQAGRALLANPPGPDCLSPEVLHDVVERGRRSRSYGVCMDHVSECIACRRLLRDSQALRLAARSRPTHLRTWLGGLRSSLVPAALGGAVVAGALYLAVIHPLSRTDVAQGTSSPAPTIDRDPRGREILERDLFVTRRRADDLGRQVEEQQRALQKLRTASMATSRETGISPERLQKATRDLVRTHNRIAILERQVQTLARIAENGAPSGDIRLPNEVAALSTTERVQAGAPPNAIPANNDAVSVVRPVATRVPTLRPVLEVALSDRSIESLEIGLYEETSGRAVPGIFLTTGDEAAGDIGLRRRWQPTDSLEPGQTYIWGAIGTRDGQRISSRTVKFRTLTAAQIIALAKRDIQFGLADGAEVMLTELLAHAPNTTARTLLNSLRKQRRTPPPSPTPSAR